MEPDIIPLHSVSPPPLDDDGDGEVGSEEDEFGDFGGFSVGESPDSLSSFRQLSSTTIKPATLQSTCGFNHPVEQSQPTSTVHVGSEQAEHPWCCGFSPIDRKEQWDARGKEGRKSSNSLGEHRQDSGQDVVMDSEPRSHCACETKKENVCTKVKHCEKRDATLVQTSQDHDQPQDFQSEEPISREECGDIQRERGHCLNSLHTTGVKEDGESDGEGRGNSISTVPQTFSVYESASEDLTSFCDDFSIECPSLDLEPNVSSLVSQDDETDWDPTDDDEEGEALGNDRQSEEDKGFHFCDQSATQETSATSELSQTGTHAEENFADFRECTLEQGHVQSDDDEEGLSLGNLPPSDSFADFCSAPTQEDGEDSWAEFKDQRAQEDGRNWTEFKEPVSSLQAEEPERGGWCGGSRRNSCQASLSCRVQQLLVAHFPEVEVPAVESEEEVLSLDALSQWIGRGVWLPHQDLHDAVGLKFQWGGSYTNRTLLRCLGVETRNIVFIGMKKQPVAVPAFASGLGMLEPTKDSVAAVSSPRHTAVITTQTTPPKPPDSPDRSTYSMQEALPPRQLAWSSSQDGTSPRRAPHFWGWK
ncbi:Aftiphilin [Dissostichus eleginoides]|uniref:Aftiphilin n=1 Tax=Dissostichus eleginoides TaxID=100907 RepID=A0AAD9FN77_DISEL|nr:Aftiphilin [Dissostichus eleginoides]